MRFRFPFLLMAAYAVSAVSAFCAATAAPASGRPAPESAYDTTRARKLYQDGDFDQAIRIIQIGLTQSKSLSHSDSVFAFKHLGVMYAAAEATRERGKYYMLQLLTIEPTARIMDMYASDMIYMIFRNIQEEFATTQAKLTRAQGHVDGNQTSPRDEPVETRTNERSRSAEAKPGTRKLGPWIMGGSIALAVGVGVGVYLLNQEEPAKVVNQEVP